MITVSIAINGQPIATRSAVNIGYGRYRCDEGTIITHKRENGAMELAKKMLDTVVTMKKENEL
jgi:hypothetical protein